jgi:hypothetical protein
MEREKEIKEEMRKNKIEQTSQQKPAGIFSTEINPRSNPLVYYLIRVILDLYVIFFPVDI